MKLSLFFAFLALTAVFSQEIVPDATFSELEETYLAIGTLNLTCGAGGVPSSPSAIASTLYEIDNLAAPVGTYNGTFALTDGSFTRVVRNIQTTPANPAGSALTNFLAYALRTNGTGDLNQISFITRYNAVGGVFNSTQSCNETVVDQTFIFDFRATYRFYKSREPSTDGRNARKRATYRAVGTLSINCSAPNTQFGIQSLMSNVENGAVVGFYNGSFVHNDGSFTRVVPPLIASTNATGGSSLVYFLANALSNPGTGALSNIAFITRFDTVGGVLNSTACIGIPSDTVYTGIPFEASYGFYETTSSSLPGSSVNPTTTTGGAASIAFCGLFVALVAILMM